MPSTWRRPIAGAFFAGALMVGPLDLFHTATGFQTYLQHNIFSITPWHWPWYLPLQMGIIGIIVLLGWTMFRRYVVDLIHGPEPDNWTHHWFVYPFSVMIVTGGYVMAWKLMGSADFTTWCVLAFVLLLLPVALWGTRHQLLAFVLIAPTGIFAEWVLLDPAIGYYEFARPDWFGRSSTWLLTTYGGVGLFIHQLSRMVDRPKTSE